MHKSDTPTALYKEYIATKQYSKVLQLLYDIQHPQLNVLFPKIPMSDTDIKSANYPDITTNELAILMAYIRKERITSWIICVSMISIGSVVTLSVIITAILFTIVDRAYLYWLCLSVALMIPASILLYLGYWGLSADYTLVHYGTVADSKKTVDIN